MARHTATQQLRYTDPMDVYVQLLPMAVNHLLLDEDVVTVAQVNSGTSVLDSLNRSRLLDCVMNIIASNRVTATATY